MAKSLINYTRRDMFFLAIPLVSLIANTIYKMFTAFFVNENTEIPDATVYIQLSLIKLKMCMLYMFQQ